jgi:hypothetical protein
MENHGTARIHGVTFTLTEQPYYDNYGTKGEIRFYALALSPEGKPVKLTWETTGNYDASCELYNLVEYSKCEEDCDCEDCQRIEYLKSLDGVNMNDAESLENACEWEYPIDVEYLDDEEEDLDDEEEEKQL